MKTVVFTMQWPRLIAKNPDKVCSNAGLAKFWPAGYKRPAKHRNVVREHFVGSLNWYLGW